MSAFRNGLVFVAVFFFFNLVQSTEFVPCFIWSNKITKERVPALNKVSQDVFKDEIQEYLKDDPLLVIFAEQTLSPEDFAQHDQSGVIFSNLAKLTKSSKVSYLPYVQNPIKALKHLNVTVTEVPLDKFGKSFEIPRTDILIVSLNDAMDSENRIDMLKRHDAAIASVFQDLAKTNENILAIYTAHHTSWVASEEVIKSRQARSLLAAEETSEIQQLSVNENNFHNTSNMYLYLTNSTYSLEGKPLKNVTFEFTLNTSNNTQYIFIANGKSDLHIIEINITFTNVSSLGYWMQQKPITAKVSFINETLIKNYNLSSTSEIYAPKGFSFHCGDQTFSANDFQVLLKNFQLQIFFDNANRTGKFNDAYDCVGFTTVPIWSGLFVTTILLIIMTIGLTMMMDIRTMDRFDDAKGKTITINAE